MTREPVVTRLRNRCRSTASTPVQAISRSARILLRLRLSVCLSPCLLVCLSLLGVQRRVVKDGAAVLWTEIDPAGDRTMVDRAVGTDPRIEAESTAAQVHGRPESHAADQPLELCRPSFAPALGEGVRRQRQTGGDSQ